MQSLKDHEYDYNEIDNILNQYLNRYGISYTGSVAADEQSQTRKDVLTATPVSSALRPSQLGPARENDATTLHDTPRTVGYEAKQEGSLMMTQNDGDDPVQLDLVDLEDQSHVNESRTVPNVERNERKIVAHEPSIPTLTRDINALEQRVLGNQRPNAHLDNLEDDKSRAETAIQLDDLDDVLTLSENMSESLSQHTRALARLQSNLRNYSRHTNSANILSNTRKYSGYKHALAQQYYTKGKRPPSCQRTNRSGPSTSHRISSSLPDMSLQTPKTLTKSTNSNPIYTSRSESQRRSQSQTQYSRSVLDDSLLDYPFDTSNKLVGASRALDADAASTVVVNGKLTSIEARTLLGRVHTMELLLDQSAQTIGELRRENARLQRVILSKDASTQKILTLEAEVLALRKSLKQSEESRRRQATLIERLKADSGV